MKKPMFKALIFPLLFLPFLLSGQDSLTVQINTMFDEWHGSAARADMPAYFDRIDEDGIYIGTDATENW